MYEVIHCVEQIKAKTLQFSGRNRLSFFHLLENGLKPILFLSSVKWSTHAGRAHDTFWKTERSQKHFLSRHIRPPHCTLWSERYHYIPRMSENSKYSNTSNTKSPLEMHINIHGGLTQNCEWGTAAGWGKCRPDSAVAPQGHPSWDLCGSCTGFVLPV